MVRLKRDLKAPPGYEVLSQNVGSHDIIIRQSVRAEILAKAAKEQRAELDSILKRIVESGVAGVPRSKWNGQEGWFPSDKAPGKVRLQAAKPWQLRAYGFIRSVQGRPAFVITGVDCSKKADKAKQSVLKAAGNEAFEVNKLLQ